MFTFTLQTVIGASFTSIRYRRVIEAGQAALNTDPIIQSHSLRARQAFVWCGPVARLTTLMTSVTAFVQTILEHSACAFIDAFVVVPHLTNIALSTQVAVVFTVLATLVALQTGRRHDI